MELTQPVDWINKSFIGYVMNTEFSAENLHDLSRLTTGIQSKFGESVFITPPYALHITLLDWIAPLVDYDGRDKDKLFADIQSSYDNAVAEILSSVKPFYVSFDEIKVSPSAIYTVGHDNGEFRRIREQFINNVELLPNTKLPPQIIHSSLGRFTKSIRLVEVEAYISTLSIDLKQRVTNYRLLRTTKEPNLEFETLKYYNL